MPLATHSMSNSRQKQLAQGATHIPETHSTIIPCTQEYHLTPAVKGSDFLYHCNSDWKIKLIRAEYTKSDQRYIDQDQQMNLWIRGVNIKSCIIWYQLMPKCHFLHHWNSLQLMPWATRVKSNLRKEQLMLLFNQVPSSDFLYHCNLDQKIKLIRAEHTKPDKSYIDQVRATYTNRSTYELGGSYQELHHIISNHAGVQIIAPNDEINLGGAYKTELKFYGLRQSN